MADNPLQHDLEEIRTAGGDLWQSLRGARIFVTGGTGFFGRWLLESFAHVNAQEKLGATLVALSRDPAAFLASAPHLAKDASITFHHGDVRHFGAPGGVFTHIIHAATESSGQQKLHSKLHMVETIVDGTRHVLEFARAQGHPRMLYVSSGAVYARSGKAMAETDATAPLTSDVNSEYAESKRMAEALCALYHREYGLPVTIARGFSFVGPYLPLDEHFAIGNFLRDALAGNTIHIQGDGSAVRSYLYASDLARWLWTVLVRGTPAHPYNIGADDTVSIAQLAKRVQKIVNPKTKIEILGKRMPGAAINYQVPDIARAGNELGLAPAVNLDEALRRTAEWHRAQPKHKASAPATAPLSILAKPDAIIFDFDGVMTDNRVAVLQDGREAVFCNRSDGLGIEMLRKRGIAMLVLSKEPNPVVGARCKKLGLECLQGIDVKDVALTAWLKERGFSPARTIYLGNDINDLSCMRMVGLPVAVGDAYPEAKAAAALVLTRHGGHGAVRELADRVLSAE